MAMTTSSFVVLGHYQVNLLDKLGQGVFGIVYRGTDRRRKIKVAVKQMELVKEENKEGADKIGSDAMTEIKNLQKLPSHPNIVKFFDFHFQVNSFWMVMEFCNFGNLNQYFDKYKPIDFVTKVELMQQAASAIAHLHGLSVPIIHRDLKPANIMLHYTGKRPVVKVTDFGLAKVAEDKADMAKTFMMSTFGGTPAFMAPEFFLRQKYTSSVDVFALGLVFLGMLNYDKAGDIVPVLGSDMIMPIGMTIAQSLKSGSPPPKVVEINPRESREIKEVKEVIKTMVMAKKDDRTKIQAVRKALKNIFDKLKGRLPPPPPPPIDITETGNGGEEPPDIETNDDSEEGDIGYHLLRQAAGQMLEEKGRPREEDNARKGLLGAGRMPLLEMLLLQALGEGGDDDDESLPGGLQKGDKVRVESDIERAKLLQKEYGGWADSMREYLGKVGEVMGKVLHVIKVKFPDGVSWSYNPSLLEKVNPDGSTTPVVDSRQSRLEEVVRGLFHRYDVVQIPKEQDVVELLQKGHGGWNDRMKLCLGIKGLVNKVDKDGDVYVECINGDNWTFNPELLIKVEPDPHAKKEAGDFVLVMDDVETVKQMQVNHGGWVKGMEKCCGHTGIIKAVLPNERLRVEVAHNTWIFNENAITLVAKGEEMFEAILRRKLRLI